MFNFVFLGMPKSSEVPPEEYLLEENEERSMIEPRFVKKTIILAQRLGSYPHF